LYICYVFKEHLKHKTETIMKKYVCTVCGWVYDPGTAFEDIPDDWVCPLCGVGKDDFEVQED